MIVRDRLQRYHMRRQFGPEAALWRPDRDEQQVSAHESTLNSSMTENHAPVVHYPLLTGQPMGLFRDPLSMSEPSRNYVSQIHFDVEAPGMSGGVNSVMGLAEAGRAQMPTDRRVIIVAPDEFSPDSRGEN